MAAEFELPQDYASVRQRVFDEATSACADVLVDWPTGVLNARWPAKQRVTVLRDRVRRSGFTRSIVAFIHHLYENYPGIKVYFNDAITVSDLDWPVGVSGCDIAICQRGAAAPNQKMEKHKHNNKYY
jgi:hypothetical protein